MTAKHAEITDGDALALCVRWEIDEDGAPVLGSATISGFQHEPPYHSGNTPKQRAHLMQLVGALLDWENSRQKHDAD